MAELLQRPCPRGPVRDRDLAQRVARPVQEDERQQPLPKRLVDRAGAVAGHERCKPSRPALHHESARAQQVVFARAGEDVAEVEQPRQMPAVRALLEQEVLGDVFAGQDHRRDVERDGGRHRRQQRVELREVALRQPEADLTCAAAFGLAGDEIRPARSQLRDHAGRHRLDGCDRRSDLAQQPLFLPLRQARPGVGAEDPGKPRHREPGPAVALALRDQRRNRQRQPSGELGQRRPLGTELAAQQGREDLQDERAAQPEHEVGAGAEDRDFPGRQARCASDVEGGWQPARRVLP